MKLQPSEWYSIARRLAVISGIFSALVLALLAFNGLQSLHVAGLLTGRVDTLKTQLRQHPEDTKLQDHLRQVDVQLRQEFFRQRTFAQHGMLLLIGGLALFLLSVKLAKQYRVKLPRPEGDPPDTRPVSARGQYAVVVAGVMLAGVLAGLAYVSRQDFSPRYPTLSAQAPVWDEPDDTQSSPPDNGTAPGQNVKASAQNTTLPPKQGGGPIQPGQIPPPAPVKFTPPGPAELAKQWPCFRGSNGGGIAQVANAPTSWDGARGTNIRWKTNVPLPGESSPVVWGDALFLSGADEHQREVYCFDANTGKLRWRQPVTDLSCADKSPLEVNSETGYAAPTMVTDGAHACAMFADGDLACFDFSGKRLWAKNMGKPDNMYGFATSLTFFRDRLILQFDQTTSPDGGKSALIALDIATGQQIWKTARKAPSSWSSPIVINAGGRAEIVTCGNPQVIAYNSENGKELWRAECLSGDVAPSPVFAGGMVFAVNTGSNLAAIKPGSGAIIPAWTYQDNLPDIASPVSNGALVWIVETYGTLSCIDGKTGKKVYSQALDGEFRSSPTLAGDRLYLMDSQGMMYILSADRTYKQLGKASLGEPSNCSPAFVGGRIYIRGKHNLYCVGK